MRPSPVLMYPAVLEFIYFRWGVRHQVFIGMDVRGTPKVGLRIGRSWSGWHGTWSVVGCRWFVLMNYKGDYRRLKTVVVQLFDGQQDGIIKGADRELLACRCSGIKTKLLMQRQLPNMEEQWVWV